MSQDMKAMQLIGRLGRDPEIRSTESGGKLCKFSIATNIRYKDREITEWWEIVSFDKTAELCKQYLHKGAIVYVSGQPQQRKYTGRDNIERVALSLLLDEVHWFEKGEGGNAGERAQSSFEHPQPAVSANTEDIPW